MWTPTASDASRRFVQFLDRVARREARTTVEHDGAPIAIVPIADPRRRERVEVERDADFTILERMGDPFKAVSDEEIERAVVMAIAEVRAENREAVRRDVARPAGRASSTLARRGGAGLASREASRLFTGRRPPDNRRGFRHRGERRAAGRRGRVGARPTSDERTACPSASRPRSPSS
jgi:hypothetical protein